VLSYDAILAAPFPQAKLGVRIDRGALCSIDFLDPGMDDLPPRDPVAREVARQLMAYFANPAHIFSLPLVILGTPFQRRVWQALCEVAPGKPCRYGDVARRLASGPRAVGGACRANPIPIVVPCHRVVGVNGLVGYSGAVSGEGLAIKRWLLDHESRV
jgi:methylated-DNA-[protein]-cysteine S-methyltransferase